MAVISKRTIRRKRKSSRRGGSALIKLAGGLVFMVIVGLLTFSASTSSSVGHGSMDIRDPGTLRKHPSSDHQNGFEAPKAKVPSTSGSAEEVHVGQQKLQQLKKQEQPKPKEQPKPLERPEPQEHIQAQEPPKPQEHIEAQEPPKERKVPEEQPVTADIVHEPPKVEEKANVLNNLRGNEISGNNPLAQALPPEHHEEQHDEVAHFKIVGGGESNTHSTMYFHHHRKGKTGAVIEDMLMCHAYAFHSRGGYGGACGTIQPAKLVEYQSLLAAIGLNESLPFRCPNEFAYDHVTRRSMVPRDQYRKDDIRIFTPDYVDFLKSQVIYPPPHMDVNDHRYTIVVHIRRGEVTPCRQENQGYERYLSNLHFQMIIDKYYNIHQETRVMIFSQEESYEPWDDFRDKGYELYLDTDIADAWEHMLTADIVVLSRSSFSFIPAMVAKGKVIYTPYWHKPLRRWIHVDHEIMKKSDAETERLQLACPEHNKFGGNTLSHAVGHHKEAHQAIH